MRTVTAATIGILLVGGCSSRSPSQPPSTQANGSNRQDERNAFQKEMNPLDKADRDAAMKTVKDALAGQVDINAPDATRRLR